MTVASNGTMYHDTPLVDEVLKKYRGARPSRQQLDELTKLARDLERHARDRALVREALWPEVTKQLHDEMTAIKEVVERELPTMVNRWIGLRLPGAIGSALDERLRDHASLLLGRTGF